MMYKATIFYDATDKNTKLCMQQLGDMPGTEKTIYLDTNKKNGECAVKFGDHVDFTCSRSFLVKLDADHVRHKAIETMVFGVLDKINNPRKPHPCTSLFRKINPQEASYQWARTQLLSLNIASLPTTLSEFQGKLVPYTHARRPK